MMIRAGLLVITLLSAASPASFAQPSREHAHRIVDDSVVASALESFDARLAADVGSDGIGGITAALARGTEILWARGFGWADRARRVPADTSTIYRIGSISKTFTTLALAQLAAEGVLDIDEPAVRYLPELANLPGGRDTILGVTFRRLASHTAGLAREPALEGAASGPLAEWEAKILASIPTTSFLDAPGRRYAYSNIGVGILGLAISRAARQPFMELIGDRILHPLGIERTGFRLTPDMETHLAVGYLNREDGSVDTTIPAREHDGRGYKVPNGAIYSTVGDLARFAAALTGRSPVELLPVGWRREMMRVQMPTDADDGYGLGLRVERDQGGVQAVGHGGSVAGYTAHLVFDPASGLAVILLRNYNRGATDLGGAARDLLRAVAGRLPIAER